MYLSFRLFKAISSGEAFFLGILDTPDRWETPDNYDKLLVVKSWSKFEEIPVR